MREEFPGTVSVSLDGHQNTLGSTGSHEAYCVVISVHYGRRHAYYLGLHLSGDKTASVLDKQTWICSKEVPITILSLSLSPSLPPSLSPFPSTRSHYLILFLFCSEKLYASVQPCFHVSASISLVLCLAGESWICADSWGGF